MPSYVISVLAMSQGAQGNAIIPYITYIKYIRASHCVEHNAIIRKLRNTWHNKLRHPAVIMQSANSH